MKKNQRPKEGGGPCVPPSLPQVQIFLGQKGLPEGTAKAFYNFYRSKKWKTKRGRPVRNWKTAANNWMDDHRQQTF